MNTKLKCLLLDDELPGLTYLRMLCEQFPNVEIVKAFDDVDKFLEAYPSLDFNVCILDIEMPKMNGLDVAKLLSNTSVIFTTAYKEYAADAYDINAVDYLQKPIKRERLEVALGKARVLVNSIANQKKNYLFNTDKGKTLIHFDEIAYITSSETDKRDKTIFLVNQQKFTLKNITFEQLLNLLPQKLFCRINKKDIIALKAVQYFSHDEITTNFFGLSTPLQKFALSDIYSADFKSKMS